MNSARLQTLLRPLEGALPALLAGGGLAFSGVSAYWDIATHVDGGRERFLTPPHLGIYSGVTAALVVIGSAMLARRLADGVSVGAAVLHPFRGARPGLAAAGTGLGVALAAAPIDNAWHEIYGIDVTIWSPPHLLAIFGVAVAALGLAMLVAPATAHHRPLLHHFLLSSFLGGLILTTAEFEFNGPQYRIAYHPLILAASTTLVLVAAAYGPARWSATRVATWFEVARLTSVVLLVALGHSLPYVPLLLPTAIAADAFGARLRQSPVVAGAALGLMTVAINVLLLELLNGIKWRGDDLIYGAIGAVFASGAAGGLGARLGEILAGVRIGSSSRVNWRRTATAASLLIVLVPSAAVAHEVGGDAGAGVVSWQPAEVGVGDEVVLEVRDLDIVSGAGVESVRVEAWRAEHRLMIPLTREDTSYSGRFRLPEQGPWMLLIRVAAGDEALLATQQVEVTDRPTAGVGHHQESFTLGLDTLSGSDPPGWLDALAYLVSVAVLLLLIRGLVRSLRRLADEGAATAA